MFPNLLDDRIPAGHDVGSIQDVVRESHRLATQREPGHPNGARPRAATRFRPHYSGDRD